MSNKLVYSYEITGTSGHDRISKLLSPNWIDVTAVTRKYPSDEKRRQESNIIAEGSTSAQLQTSPPDFLWENEYDRHSTRPYRNRVKCYSHLPNGRLLDDKWALAKLFGFGGVEKQVGVGILPSHCFKGSRGFYDFALRVGLLSEVCHSDTATLNCTNTPTQLQESSERNHKQQSSFVELDAVCNYLQLEQKSAPPLDIPAQPANIWVVKDAATNAAGGIWMISPNTVSSFYSHLLTHNNKQQQHRYVAQKYAWPPILYQQRKFHIRVYSVMTADASIYVHRMCFLHVANDPFNLSSEDSEMPATVHITNCCANSDDEEKFAGEIVATLFDTDDVVSSDETKAIDLSPFLSSISASIQKILIEFFPFVSGGILNGGFEYMGLDFLLSYASVVPTDNNINRDPSAGTSIPVAYLLEINAPPSQGTATGLHSAEMVHDTVLQDLINLWVVPCVNGAKPALGGWKLVHQLNDDALNSSNSSLPKNSSSPSFHQAAMMNRIRWKLFDMKCNNTNETKRGIKIRNGHDPHQSRNHKIQRNNDGDRLSWKNEDEQRKDASGSAEWTTECQEISNFSRLAFPYFSRNQLDDAALFLESGGGSQVPQTVIDVMTLALSHRDRSTVGAWYKDTARKCFKSFLGVPPSHYDQFALFLGSNATSLLATLAQKYTPMLSNEDEVVIAEHNHEANIVPWLETAKVSGAKVLWWEIGKPIQLVLSSRTRIVAISHASNILGSIYPIRQISELVHIVTGGKARVVVDGVAAVPHRPASMLDAGVDWYVISGHKCFGPHIGALCGVISAATECSCASWKSKGVSCALPDKSILYHDWEKGTVNYESCAGVLGLGMYLQSLARVGQEFPISDSQVQPLSVDIVTEAYKKIVCVEKPTRSELLSYLYACSNVQVLEERDVSENSHNRLPVISFVHDKISSRSIVQWCLGHKISCRNGCFLSKKVLERFHVRDTDDGIVRFSLAHYNTPIEVRRVISVLNGLDGWAS